MRAHDGKVACAAARTPRCPLQYAEELIATAKAIAAPGKGILAADESTGTIGKRVRRPGQSSSALTAAL